MAGLAELESDTHLRIHKKFKSADDRRQWTLMKAGLMVRAGIVFADRSPALKPMAGSRSQP